MQQTGWQSVRVKLIAAHLPALGRVTIGDQLHAFLFGRDAPASSTPSAPAFCRVALCVRLSLRAIVAVAVFSRTMVFNIRTSSLVHRRDLLVCFAITWLS
jgi:hypothetical protein